MTPSPARDWLPVDAFDHPAIRRQADQAIAAWSAAWLPRRTLSVVAWTPSADDRRDDADGAGWRATASGLAISLTRRARARLLGWALDTHLDEAGLSDADRHVLDGFGHAMVEDLMTRLHRAWTLPSSEVVTLAATDAPLANGGVVASVGEAAGGGLLALALPAHVLLPLMRKALPPRRRAPGAPSARRRALAGLPVRLQARLGGAALSLGDLRNLAAGDVLVLDRPITEGAELVLAADGVRIGRGDLSDIDGATTLTFQRS